MATRATWARLISDLDDPSDMWAVAQRLLVASGGSEREPRTARFNALFEVAELGASNETLAALCYGAEGPEIEFVRGALGGQEPDTPTARGGWLLSVAAEQITTVDEDELLAVVDGDVGTLVAHRAILGLTLSRLNAFLELRRDPFLDAGTVGEAMRDHIVDVWRTAEHAGPVNHTKMWAGIATRAHAVWKRWTKAMRDADPEVVAAVGDLDGWLGVSHFAALLAGPGEWSALESKVHPDTRRTITLMGRFDCATVEELFDRIDSDAELREELVPLPSAGGRPQGSAGITLIAANMWALWRSGFATAYLLGQQSGPWPFDRGIPRRIALPMVGLAALAEQREINQVYRRESAQVPNAVQHRWKEALIGRDMFAGAADLVMEERDPIDPIDLGELAMLLSGIAGRDLQLMDPDLLGAGGIPLPSGNHEEDIATLCDLMFSAAVLAERNQVLDVAGDEPDNPAPPAPETEQESDTPAEAPTDRFSDTAESLAGELAGVDPFTLSGSEWSELFDKVGEHRLAWDELTLVAALELLTSPSSPRTVQGGVATALVLDAAGDRVGAVSTATNTLRAAHPEIRSTVAASLGDLAPRTLQVDASADPSAPAAPTTPVAVLWVGGNETQRTYIEELNTAIEEQYGGRVSVEYVLAGWGSNWLRYAEQVGRRLNSGSVDAVCLSYFVRTGLGRSVRRDASEASVPWIATRGHGRGAMLDAIGDAVAVVDRLRDRT